MFEKKKPERRMARVAGNMYVTIEVVDVPDGVLYVTHNGGSTPAQTFVAMGNYKKDELFRQLEGEN